MPENVHSRPTTAGRARRLRHALGFGNIGAVYVWIGIIIFFSIEKPSQFPTLETVKLVLNLNAIAGLAALSLIVPLCTRRFDLSIGYIMALTSVVSANIIVSHGGSFVVAVILCAAIALAAGVLNGILVVIVKIDSFIATLATGAFFGAVVSLVSGEVQQTNARLASDFTKLATTNIGGITVPVFIMLAIAAAVWWLLEHTVTGRRLYATGFNEDAARLTGIRTQRLQFAGLLVSALVSGLAGVLVTAQFGSGAPAVGPSYLLSSFTAVFLGATQLRNGRFNVPGTLIAVLMLGTGTAGLSLVGAEPWVSSMFTGVVLISSLLLFRIEQVRTANRRKTLPPRRPPSPDDGTTSGGARSELARS